MEWTLEDLKLKGEIINDLEIQLELLEPSEAER